MFTWIIELLQKKNILELITSDTYSIKFLNNVTKNVGMRLLGVKTQDFISIWHTKTVECDMINFFAC